MPFVKLDCGIIHSSLWAEDSDTKICWITLLLLADSTGFVRAAASAIAREAGISAAAGRRALELFASPDDESRTPDNQGKRIEKVEGGYRVLNYEKYRERDYTNAERQKRWRKRNVTNALRNGAVTARNTSRSRAQKQNKKKKAAAEPPTVEERLTELQQKEIYKHINVRALHAKMVVWCEVRGLQPTLRRLVTWLNKEDKPMGRNGATKPDYKRNYPPPAREPTEAEIQNARTIARRETEKLRQSLRS